MSRNHRQGVQVDDVKEIMYLTRKSPGFPPKERVVVTVSRGHWDKLSHVERNRLFVMGVVHVVGRPSNPPHGVSGIDDPKFQNLVNLNITRNCGGPSAIACVPF